MAWMPRNIRSVTRTIKTLARYDYVPPSDAEAPTYLRSAGLATPRQLVQYLDEYVVGQENAKKVLSVAVFNHYNRVRANLANISDEGVSDWVGSNANEYEPIARGAAASLQLHPHPYRVSSPAAIPLQPRYHMPMFEKSNVLVIGPTGSGKTLLARTLAKVLDVPFSVSDATSFTQAGYVGEDVDMCIQRLLQAANWDQQRASTGIVYIDEVDKLARKNGGIEGSRDVGGEGVQQALLRMMEGSVVTVQAKAAAVETGTVGAEGRPRPGSRSMNPPKHDTYQIDTSGVLFILSGAFVGLENILKQRISRGSIGFTANLSSIPEGDDGGFIPFFTPNRKASNNILDMVEPADLIKFGFIPEFISRLPTITTLAPLTTQDLLRILTEVRGSLISQYTSLFGYSGVEIRFTTPALKEICRKATDRGGGARGLRGIMETLLLDAMYEAPGSAVRHVLITAAVARGEQPALYWSRGEGAAFWANWAEEESLQTAELKD